MEKAKEYLLKGSWDNIHPSNEPYVDENVYDGGREVLDKALMIAMCEGVRFATGISLMDAKRSIQNDEDLKKFFDRRSLSRKLGRI